MAIIKQSRIFVSKYRAWGFCILQWLFASLSDDILGFFCETSRSNIYTDLQLSFPRLDGLLVFCGGYLGILINCKCRHLIIYRKFCNRFWSLVHIKRTIFTATNAHAATFSTLI